MTNISKYANSWVYKPKKITVGRGLAYGLTDLMGGGWNNIVSGVIFTFLAFQGFDPAIAGAITGVARIVDAIFSLFFGIITDGFYKTKLGQRFGRRHFFIGVGIIFFAVIFPLFWLNVQGADGKPSFLYYCLIYCAIEIIIAFILIPWETLPTEMTTDYKLRTVLSGSRMFISATGTTIVFIVMAVLKNMDNPDAYMWTGIIYTVIFVIAMSISYFTTWEKALDAKTIAELDAQPKLTINAFLVKTLRDYASTFRNGAFNKHLSVYLLSFTGKDFYATVLPTFIVYSCLMGDGDPWTLNAMAFFGIFATLLASWLMIEKGPKFLFTSSYSIIILSMIGYLLVFLFEVPNPLILMLVITVFYQIGRATLEFTPWNVFPFIPDVDYIMTRESRAGVYAAVMTFFRKSTGAIAAMVAGVLLQEVGWNSAPKIDPDRVGDFDENGNAIKCLSECIHDYAAGEPWDERLAITFVFFFGTLLLIVLALIIAQVFRLDRHTHSILKAEIERLEAGGAKDDVTDEAKSVVEKLTGHPYEQCWPDTPGIRVSPAKWELNEKIKLLEKRLEELEAK